jgi:hypothetical protein
VVELRVAAALTVAIASKPARRVRLEHRPDGRPLLGAEEDRDRRCGRAPVGQPGKVGVVEVEHVARGGRADHAVGQLVARLPRGGRAGLALASVGGCQPAAGRGSTTPTSPPPSPGCSTTPVS